jgi:hypothetical protein
MDAGQKRMTINLMAKFYDQNNKPSNSTKPEKF